MKFVQFWTTALDGSYRVVPAHDSRGHDARKVDGRWGVERIKKFVEDGSYPAHYIGYSIHQGTSFLDEGPLTPIIRFRTRSIR